MGRDYRTKTRFNHHVLTPCMRKTQSFRQPNVGTAIAMLVIADGNVSGVFPPLLERCPEARKPGVGKHLG